MSARKDGGPAFPSGVGDKRTADEGMSIRDWFAGQALVGLSATDVRPFSLNATIARNAYEIADAMLAEREKGGA